MAEIERRKMERFSLELPVLLSMVDESGIQRAFEAMTKNICSGGGFFITDKPMSVGTDVKMGLILSINKEKKAHVDASGSVIRTEEQGIAVRFDKKYNISPLNG